MSSNGGTYYSPSSVTIPATTTSFQFSISAESGYDYVLSAHNPVDTTPFTGGKVNRVGNSVNFDVNVREPLLGYSDVSSSPEDFDSPNDRRYRNFIGAPSYFHIGNQRTKDYQTSSTYTTAPPQPFLLKTQDASGPLAYGGSQIVYVPKEYYVWPESDYAAPYITESRVPLQVDGLGRSSGMQVGRYPYTLTSNTTYSIGLFVKDFGTATIPGASEGDDTIANSKYFSIEMALGGGAFSRRTFVWNPDSTLSWHSVDASVLGGFHNIQDIGDGWYRVRMSITGVPLDAVGQDFYYKIYPHTLGSGPMVGSSVPTDVSGTMMTGLMLDEGTALDPHHPQIDCFGTPLGGVRTSNSGITETTFTL